VNGVGSIPAVHMPGANGQNADGMCPAQSNPEPSALHLETQSAQPSFILKRKVLNQVSFFLQLFICARFVQPEQTVHPYKQMQNVHVQTKHQNADHHDFRP
jgi:hypothetical protein